MTLFPLIGLDNEPYSTVLEYIEANRRFAYKIGVDMPFVNPRLGLDGNPYYSLYELQSADEAYYLEQLNLKSKSR